MKYNKWLFGVPVAFGLVLFLMAGWMSVRDARNAALQNGKVQQIFVKKKAAQEKFTVTAQAQIKAVNSKGKRAKMANYNSAGAGTTGYIGRFSPSGTLNGAVLYEIDSTHLMGWNSTLHLWAMAATTTDISGSAGTGIAYYSSAGNISTVPLTGWTVNSPNGTSPAPTLTLIAGRKRSSCC